MSLISCDVGAGASIARLRAGLAITYGTVVWQETQEVSTWPVRIFLALANQTSIRSSKYFAAPSRSQPPDAARFSCEDPRRAAPVRPRSKRKMTTLAERRIEMSDKPRCLFVNTIAAPFRGER